MTTISKWKGKREKEKERQEDNDMGPCTCQLDSNYIFKTGKSYK